MGARAGDAEEVSAIDPGLEAKLLSIHSAAAVGVGLPPAQRKAFEVAQVLFDLAQLRVKQRRRGQAVRFAEESLVLARSIGHAVQTKLAERLLIRAGRHS